MEIRETILQALRWRYAVKRFDPTRTISDADWRVLEESLRMAPSSYGLQPWKFIVIQTRDIKARLRPASWNQSQVTDCSHLVVFTSRKTIDETYIEKYIQFEAKVRNREIDAMGNYKKMMVGDLVHGGRANEIRWWAQKQTYLAMGFLLETAALLQIDSCPLEGIEPSQYDEILGLSHSAYGTVAGTALGYRHLQDNYQHAAKVRFDAGDVVEHR